LIHDRTIPVLKLVVEEIAKTEEVKDEEEEKAPALPSIDEIVTKLLDLGKNDETFRSGLPDGAKVATSAFLNGSCLKDVVVEVIKNVPAIGDNEFIKSLDVEKNWEELVCNSGAFGRRGGSPFHILKLFKKGMKQKNVHWGITCDACSAHPIVGNRYKCKTCNDFDLCEECKESGKHSEHNDWDVIDRAVRGCPRWRRAAVPKLSSLFVADVNYPDGTEFKLGEEPLLIKTWTLKNDGDLDWPEGTKLIFVGNEGKALAYQTEFVVGSLKVGEETNVSAVLKSPKVAGTYRVAFRLADEKGTEFGHWIWAELKFV